jgi:flagellar FliL protein
MSEEAAATAEAPAEAKAPKSPSPWPPVIAVIVLMPAISFALTQYVLIPKLKSTAATTQAAKDAPADSKGSTASSAGGAKADAKPSFSYEFTDVVVNLSGAMGTRYLKTSFSIFSSNPDLQKIITDNKPHLLDVALNVLSSKSMADLETPGSKNLVRNDLMANFNQALNSEIVEQIYFSEFVVQ